MSVTDKGVFSVFCREYWCNKWVSWSYIIIWCFQCHHHFIYFVVFHFTCTMMMFRRGGLWSWCSINCHAWQRDQEVCQCHYHGWSNSREDGTLWSCHHLPTWSASTSNWWNCASCNATYWNNQHYWWWWWAHLEQNYSHHAVVSCLHPACLACLCSVLS